MQIEHDDFIAWADQKFNGDFEVSGPEVKVNDPWWVNEDGLPDSDHKCWINTSKCCFRAFKSNRTGHLLEFVMDREGCSWEEALEIIGGTESFQSMEKKLIEFLEGYKPETKVVNQSPVKLPEQTVLISSLLGYNSVCQWANDYLKSRKINPNGLMVCLSGKYRNRIVIPYYGPNGDLIYFNTRALSDKDKLRYRGPNKDQFGVGKGDVIWMSSWPKNGEKIYLTEGEFDAMTLAQCGLNGAAVGSKEVSDKQITMMRPYRIALAFDADKAGKDVYEVSQKILGASKWLMDDGRIRISIIRPPKQYKDWNNFYAKHSKEVVLAYISKYEKECNSDTLAKMRFGEL